MINVIIFIYVYLCPTRFPYQMTFVSFNDNATGVTTGAGTDALPEYLRSPPVFSRARVARSVISCVVFCLLSFFFLAIVLSVFLQFTASDILL